MALYYVLVEDTLPRGWMPEPPTAWFKDLIEDSDNWLRVLSVEEVK